MSKAVGKLPQPLCRRGLGCGNCALSLEAHAEGRAAGPGAPSCPGLWSEETGCVCGCSITQQLQVEVSSGNPDPGQVAKANFKPKEEAESVTSILLTCLLGCRPSAHFPTQPRDTGTDQRCFPSRSNKPLPSLRGLAAQAYGEACSGF